MNASSRSYTGATVEVSIVGGKINTVSMTLGSDFEIN